MDCIGTDAPMCFESLNLVKKNVTKWYAKCYVLLFKKTLTPNATDVGTLISAMAKHNWHGNEKALLFVTKLRQLNIFLLAFWQCGLGQQLLVNCYSLWKETCLFFFTDIHWLCSWAIPMKILRRHWLQQHHNNWRKPWQCCLRIDSH